MILNQIPLQQTIFKADIAKSEPMIYVQRLPKSLYNDSDKLSVISRDKIVELEQMVI